AQEPRKNVPALVAAVARVRADFPDLTLALVGPRGNGSAAVQRALAEHQMDSVVRELGFVPPDDLPILYRGARALLYASRLEGFGMPPLEAMASGTPVIAAPNPPLPEVLGNAALFVADDSPLALADGIRKLLRDATLQAELRERGIAHARAFTWER